MLSDQRLRDALTAADPEGSGVGGEIYESTSLPSGL